MRTYIYSLLILIATLSIVSCKNELPFDIKNNPPKLVMNALINADSVTNVLYLNFTGQEHVGQVQNATVEVCVNGTMRESLHPLPPETDTDQQARFNITGPFAPGDVVRIDARTNDGKYHAWAEVTVPQRLANIVSIDTLTVPITQYYYTENYMRYKITFSDLPNENNYYRLVVDRQLSLWGYNHTEAEGERIYWTRHLSSSFIGHEDIVLTDGRPSNSADENNGPFDTSQNIYGVFDDARFQNTSYTMTIYTSMDIYTPTQITGYYDGMDVIIRLLSITEEEYYYLKALNLVDSGSYDETINEPIKYPSNVRGGTGMVGMSSESSKKIRIKSWKR